jgi:hypothetical protein
MADYDAVLKILPKVAESLYGRGLTKQKKGDSTGAHADLSEASAIDAGIAEKFEKYGVK